MVVSEKPVQGVLSLIAPDGSVAAKSADRLGGSAPYSWFAEVASPAAGTWHATLLERQSRSAVASALRRFLTTPEAMHLMRSPATGIPPSRFRPPVYVTIWS